MRRNVITLLAALFLTSSYAFSQVKIHVIDVGQADAVLLEFRKAAVLIDAGGESTGDDRDKDHLLAYLNDFFSRRSDLKHTLHAVIVTHAHIDHTKLLMDVLQNFKVKYFYDGGDTTGSGASQLKKARKFATAHKIQYLAIDDDTIGKNGFTPPGLKKLASSSSVDMRFMTGSRSCQNANNNSLIVRLQYKKVSAILSGDAEVNGDEGCDEGQTSHLLERYQGSNLLNVDIYKVGHHGSANATDDELESVLSPKISLISAGHKETRSPGKFHGYYFGHPREQVVTTLETGSTSRPAISGYTYIKGSQIKDDRRVDKAVYCTCWDHDITLSVNAEADSITVSGSN